eukprot:g3969.t1
MAETAIPTTAPLPPGALDSIPVSRPRPTPLDLLGDGSFNFNLAANSIANSMFTTPQGGNCMGGDHIQSIFQTATSMLQQQGQHISVNDLNANFGGDRTQQQKTNVGDGNTNPSNELLRTTTMNSNASSFWPEASLFLTPSASSVGCLSNLSNHTTPMLVDATTTRNLASQQMEVTQRLDRAMSCDSTMSQAVSCLSNFDNLGRNNTNNMSLSVMSLSSMNNSGAPPSMNNSGAPMLNNGASGISSCGGHMMQPGDMNMIANSLSNCNGNNFQQQGGFQHQMGGMINNCDTGMMMGSSCQMMNMPTAGGSSGNINYNSQEIFGSQGRATKGGSSGSYSLDNGVDGVCKDHKGSHHACGPGGRRDAMSTFSGGGGGGGGPTTSSHFAPATHFAQSHSHAANTGACTWGASAAPSVGGFTGSGKGSASASSSSWNRSKPGFYNWPPGGPAASGHNHPTGGGKETNANGYQPREATEKACHVTQTALAMLEDAFKSQERDREAAASQIAYCARTEPDSLRFCIHRCTEKIQHGESVLPEGRPREGAKPEKGAALSYAQAVANADSIIQAIQPIFLDLASCDSGKVSVLLRCWLDLIILQERVEPLQQILRDLVPRLPDLGRQEKAARTVQKVVEAIGERCTTWPQLLEGLRACLDAMPPLTTANPRREHTTAHLLITDEHGHHILQRIVKLYMEKELRGGEYLVDYVQGRVAEFACDRQGNLIERADDEQWKADVVERMIDFGVRDLCCQKHSSNVLEKCLEHGHDHAAPVRRLVQELLRDPAAFEVIFRDKFGNYVLQRALAVMCDKSQSLDLFHAMLRILMPMLLRNTTIVPHAGPRYSAVDGGVDSITPPLPSHLKSVSMKILTRYRLNFLEVAQNDGAASIGDTILRLTESSAAAAAADTAAARCNKAAPPMVAPWGEVAPAASSVGTKGGSFMSASIGSGCAGKGGGKGSFNMAESLSNSSCGNSASSSCWGRIPGGYNAPPGGGTGAAAGRGKPLGGGRGGGAGARQNQFLQYKPGGAADMFRSAAAA